MHYFVFTFNVYADSTFITGGKIGKTSLVGIIKPDQIKNLLLKYYASTLNLTKGLSIEIVQSKKVFKNDYELVAKDFVKM